MIVYQCTLDGNLVKVWDSIRNAARELHYQYNGIRSCCKGGFYRKGKWVNCHKYKGFKWMFKSDYEEMLAGLSN